MRPPRQKRPPQKKREDDSMGEEKYYKNFDFFFKRTSFRTMTLFFKMTFKPYFEKFKHCKKGQTIQEFLREYAEVAFPGLLADLNSVAQIEFIELLKLLVFSHRHNKNDAFLQDPLVDFSIVREPMYKYSKNAQEAFFQISTFAFLFVWFTNDAGAKNFAREKFNENPSKTYPSRMEHEISVLGADAAKALRKAASTLPGSQTSHESVLCAQTKQHLNRVLAAHAAKLLK